MTEPPPHLPPHNPAPVVSQSDTRPLSVTILATLCVVVGAMGFFCCGVLGVVKPFTAAATMSQMTNVDPATLPKPEPVVVAATLALGLVDLATSAVMVVCGIGAFALRSWARTGAVLNAIAMIVIAIVAVIATITFLGPRTEAYELQVIAVLKQSPGATGDLTFKPFHSVGTALAGVLIAVARIGIPVLILLFWTKPAAIDAFTFRQKSARPAVAPAESW